MFWSENTSPCQSLAKLESSRFIQINKIPIDFFFFFSNRLESEEDSFFSRLHKTGEKNIFTNPIF